MTAFVLNNRLLIMLYFRFYTTNCLLLSGAMYVSMKHEKKYMNLVSKHIVCRTSVIRVGPLDLWVFSEIDAQIRSISKFMGTPKKGVWILLLQFLVIAKLTFFLTAQSDKSLCFTVSMYSSTLQY